MLISTALVRDTLGGGSLEVGLMRDFSLRPLSSPLVRSMACQVVDKPQPEFPVHVLKVRLIFRHLSVYMCRRGKVRSNVLFTLVGNKRDRLGSTVAVGLPTQARLYIRTEMEHLLKEELLKDRDTGRPQLTTLLSLLLQLKQEPSEVLLLYGNDCVLLDLFTASLLKRKEGESWMLGAVSRSVWDSPLYSWTRYAEGGTRNHVAPLVSN